MQKQIFADTSPENESFSVILARAHDGDIQATMKILDIFQPEMDYLACFIRMPKEDSIQELKTTFIEIIRKGDLWVS